MFLFQDVDLKQTEQNALKFFSDDYRRLCSMAGANLQSPALSVHLLRQTFKILKKTSLLS